MRRNKIIYSLCVGDIHDVAEDELNRKLTEEELKKVINRVGDYISWHDAIEFTLSELRLEPAEEEQA